MAQHDSGYHLLFSHPELVEDLLKNFVPEEWVKQLDFSRMKRINAKFHSDGLDKREGDLVYRIQYKDGSGEIYVYLLLEFQSTPDKWMALRVLVYVGLLYQHLIKEKQINESSLPPVFPLVLYNGDEPWHCAQDLQSLIALPSQSPLKKWQPQIHYYLLDENLYPDGKNNSISGTLFKIENSHNINELRDNMALLEQQLPLTQSSLRRAVATWIYYVIAAHKGLQLDKQDVQDLTEVREMLSTRIKRWEQEVAEKSSEQGFEKGIEQGLEEGMQQGQHLEKINMLKKMLVLKFDAIPDQILQQIDDAKAVQLDHWLERLISENSLAEVFK